MSQFQSLNTQNMENWIQHKTGKQSEIQIQNIVLYLKEDMFQILAAFILSMAL